MTRLIEKRMIEEAVTAKLEMLQELKAVEHMDASNTLTKLIRKGEEALEQLKKRKNLQAASKHFHNLGTKA